jgi:hypothetical protein
MRDIPYNITTDAGRRLWTYLNNQHGSGTWGLAGELIPLIEREARERGAALDELQRLAEETGEYETFDNPLVDGETASPEIELGVDALELGVFRERARVVALLEAEASELEGDGCADDCRIRAEELRLAVALIRGEDE